MCKFPGCGRPHEAHGVCHTHLAQMNRGRPLTPIRARFTGSVAHRLMSRVTRGAGCWEWTGALADNGYGSIRVGGRAAGAHKVSWQVHVGEVPRGLCVLHRCDNRRCVRPDHLFLGTQADNMSDCRDKGRFVFPQIRRGEKNNKAILTEAEVKEIRASGARHAVLAARYGVAAVTVRMIRYRRLWKHVP